MFVDFEDFSDVYGLSIEGYSDEFGLGFDYEAYSNDLRLGLGLCFEASLSIWLLKVYSDDLGLGFDCEASLTIDFEDYSIYFSDVSVDFEACFFLLWRCFYWFYSIYL